MKCTAESDCLGTAWVGLDPRRTCPGRGWRAVLGMVGVGAARCGQVAARDVDLEVGRGGRASAVVDRLVGGRVFCAVSGLTRGRRSKSSRSGPVWRSREERDGPGASRGASPSAGRHNVDPRKPARQGARRPLGCVGTGLLESASGRVPSRSAA